MTSTDALSAIGLVAILVGLWLVWPPLAIIAVGATLLSTAVGLALLRRRGDAGSGRHEG